MSGEPDTGIDLSDLGPDVGPLQRRAERHFRALEAQRRRDREGHGTFALGREGDPPAPTVSVTDPAGAAVSVTDLAVDATPVADLAVAPASVPAPPPSEPAIPVIALATSSGSGTEGQPPDGPAPAGRSAAALDLERAMAALRNVLPADGGDVTGPPDRPATDEVLRRLEGAAARLRAGTPDRGDD